MAKIIKASLTEYYPFEKNLTRREKRMEGGTVDRRGKPLYTLEDYVDGIAPYVSAACDSLGGAPGYVKVVPAAIEAFRFRRRLVEFSARRPRRKDFGGREMFFPELLIFVEAPIRCFGSKKSNGRAIHFPVREFCKRRFYKICRRRIH
jgi:hypothetical protein